MSADLELHNETNQTVETLPVTVRYGQGHINDAHTMDEYQLESVIEWIESEISLKDACEKIRAINAKRIAATGDEGKALDKERQEVKAQKLPYFSLCEFRDNYLDKEHFLQTMYVLLDSDHLADQLATTKEKMRNDNKIMLCFISPSGDGLKFVIRLDRYVTTEDDFHKVFRALRRQFSEDYDIPIDPAEDPSRACYLSFDPDIVYNPASTKASVEVALKRSDEIKDDVASKKGKRTVPDIFKNGSPEGRRVTDLSSVVGQIVRLKTDFALGLQTVKSWNEQRNPKPLSDDELITQYTEMYKRFTRNDAAKDASFQAKKNNERLASLDQKQTEVRNLLELAKQNRDYKTSEKLLTKLERIEREQKKLINANQPNELAEVEGYLTAGYQFRFNSMGNQVEWRQIDAADYSPVTDYDVNSLSRELETNGFHKSPESLGHLLFSDFSPKYDPIDLYLSQLPSWDGRTDYIEELAETVVLEDSSQMERWKSTLKKWLVNLVAGVISPNGVNQNAIIFQGSQGIYKTTWLNKLVPRQLNPYIHVGPIIPNDKDSLILLTNNILINLDEMEAYTKYDVSHLKSTMTKKLIRVRRPWGHFYESIPRRASFVGSINKESFLNDETGSRRFLVFAVESLNADYRDDLVDQVYAEAYELYKQGFRYWFNSDEIKEVERGNARFTVETVEDALLSQYFTPALVNIADEVVDNYAAWMTPTDIAKYIATAEYPTGYKMDTKTSARDFGKALVKAKYGSRFLHGSKQYAVKPKKSEALEKAIVQQGLQKASRN